MRGAGRAGGREEPQALTVVSNDRVDLGGDVLRVPSISRLVIRQGGFRHVGQSNSLPTGGRGGDGGRGYSFIADLFRETIDHASVSRRTAIPTLDRDTSNIWKFLSL